MSSNPQKSTTGSRQQDKSNQSNQHDVASSLNADEAQTSLPMTAACPSRSPFMFMPAPTTFSYYPQVSAVYPGVVPTASSFTMPGRELLFLSNTQPSPHPRTHFTPYSLPQSSLHTSNIGLSTARYSDAIQGGEAGTPQGRSPDPLLGLAAPARTSKVQLSADQWTESHGKI